MPIVADDEEDSENDSDEDVFEGLGNTTLDIKGNIAAGISSDEEAQGTNNIQS